MKNLSSRFLSLLLCLSVSTVYAQTHEAEIVNFRKKQLEAVTSGEHAPLRPEDSVAITYFEVDNRYLLTAKVERLKSEKPFKMPTYAGDTKEFIRYARLHFDIDGVTGTLTAYKDLSLPGPMAALRSMLFVPFMDKTSGESTYGGGRYLDLSIPNNAKEIRLDFNRAYNPYCAYSDGYRCPIPPPENHLSFEVPAGEKTYTGTVRSRNMKSEAGQSLRFTEEELSLILSGDTTARLDVLQITDSLALRILRSTSTDVDPQDPFLPLLAKRMLYAVQDTARPGVGIAAPQIGINRNLIWVQRFDKPGNPFELYLNPEITWRSSLLINGPEGCLSIPDTRGDVNRHYVIRLSYLTPEGAPREEMIEGFVAVIFQHETDHLIGVLFTDRLEKQKNHIPFLPAAKLYREN